MPKPKATTIDEYLASLPLAKRAALDRLRRHIRAAAPDAEECISYGIPALRLHGRLLVHFGAAAKHCAFYPGAVVETFKHELDGYDVSKGTIRFQPEAPLPAALVERLVRAQIARRESRKGSRPARAARRGGRRQARSRTDGGAGERRTAVRGKKAGAAAPRQSGREERASRLQLLKRLDARWQALLKSYAGLSDRELAEPGVTGTWSVKDIIAHVTVWEEEALAHLPEILAGQTPPRYSVTHGGIDAFNAQMTERNRGLSLAEVVRRRDDTHHRLVAFVERLPAAALAGDTRARRRLRLDTYGHYAVHARAILKWRGRRSHAV